MELLKCWGYRVSGPNNHQILGFGSKWGFPKIRGTFWGVPIIRTIVYRGLYWGTQFWETTKYWENKMETTRILDLYWGLGFRV